MSWNSNLKRLQIWTCQLSTSMLFVFTCIPLAAQQVEATIQFQSNFLNISFTFFFTFLNVFSESLPDTWNVIHMSRSLMYLVSVLPQLRDMNMIDFILLGLSIIASWELQVKSIAIAMGASFQCWSEGRHYSVSFILITGEHGLSFSQPFLSKVWKEADEDSPMKIKPQTTNL